MLIDPRLSHVLFLPLANTLSQVASAYCCTALLYSSAHLLKHGALVQTWTHFRYIQDIEHWKYYDDIWPGCLAREISLSR
jgi:hypothetical protein